VRLQSLGSPSTEQAGSLSSDDLPIVLVHFPLLNQSLITTRHIVERKEVLQHYQIGWKKHVLLLDRAKSATKWSGIGV
jgi:hypothetical protein